MAVLENPCADVAGTTAGSGLAVLFCRQGEAMAAHRYDAKTRTLVAEGSLAMKPARIDELSMAADGTAALWFGCKNNQCRVALRSPSRHLESSGPTSSNANWVSAAWALSSWLSITS